MTTIHESWVDALRRPASGRVTFIAPAPRESTGGEGMVSTADATVDLVDGAFSIDVEPGPARVVVALDGLSPVWSLLDIPESGTHRLSELMEPVRVYPAPVVSEAWTAARLAEEMRDEATAAAKAAQIAVKVTSVNGQDGDVHLDADDVGARPAGAIPIGDVTGLRRELDGMAVFGHTHAITEVAGLQDALDDKETAGTAAALFESLVGTAPETLDTLAELAHALGDDPNFATTTAEHIAGKAPLQHEHTIADVDGLQPALKDKADAAHRHQLDDVTGLEAALTGASGAATAAQKAQSGAEGAREAAKGYRDGAQTYRDEAGGFRDEAQAARDETVIAATSVYDWASGANFASNPSLIAKPTWLRRRLTGSGVVSFVGGAAGKSYTVAIELIQDAVGGRALTWSGVSWAYGLVPVVSPAANARDVFLFTWTGSQWIGTVSAQAIA